MISIKYLIMLFQFLLLSRNVNMNVLEIKELFRHNNVWMCKLPFFFPFITSIISFHVTEYANIVVKQMFYFFDLEHVFENNTNNSVNKYSLNFWIHYFLVALFIFIQHVYAIE